MRFKFLIIFLLIFVLSSIILRIIRFQQDELEDDNYIPDNKEIYSKENFDSYKQAFNKAKNFINISLHGILINTEKINLSKKPIVSVVIPCYNCKTFILRALRSIQNQNFSDFEIIIVDDGSKSDTETYIKQIKNEEKRIRIIQNKKKYGTIIYKMHRVIICQWKIYITNG